MNMKMSRLAAACVLAGIAAGASADIVEMKFTGTGQGRNVKVTIGDHSMGVFAGQLKHTILSGTGLGAGLVGDHLTYCVDLYEYVKSAPTTYTIVSLSELPDSSPMGSARAGGVYDMVAWAAGQQFDPNISKDFAAAFQIALWEIVTDYDPSIGTASLDVTTGLLKVRDSSGGPLSSGISGYLTAMFDAVGTDSARRGIIGLRSFGAQDQIAAIPAPGPIALAVASLALAVPRRRTR